MAVGSEGQNTAMQVQMDLKLVREVEKRPLLYDYRERNYKNTAKREAAYDSVGRAIGMTANDVMKNWRRIRDRYVRVAKREKRAATEGGGAVAEESVSWECFKYMSFLADVIKPRKCKGGTVSGDDIDALETDGAVPAVWAWVEDAPVQCMYDMSTEDTCASGSMDTTHSGHPEQSSPRPPSGTALPDFVNMQNGTCATTTAILVDNDNDISSGLNITNCVSLQNETSATTPAVHADINDIGNQRKRKKELDDFKRSILTMIRQQQRLQAKPQPDPDEMFLNSLLPFLRSVPKERKLSTQMEIMDILRRNQDYTLPPE